MENRALSMRWHRVYPILLMIFATLGLGKLWFWLGELARYHQALYPPMYSRGELLFCGLLTLGEMVLCLCTAVQLRAMEPGGYRANRVLLWGLLPVSAFIQSMVRYGWICLLVIALMYFLVAVPVGAYYENRKQLFLPKEASQTC